MSRKKLALAIPFSLVGALAIGVAIADSYTIDNVHSSVYFKVKRKEISYLYGRFNKIEGKVSYDPKDISKTTFDVTIPVDSLDTNNAKRDGHLKSPDFFNAKQFPVITFKSKKVVEGDGGLAVTGDFTMHGVTKEVTLPVSIDGEADGFAGFSVNHTIKRSDYGMSGMIPMVSDEVELMISLLVTSKQSK